LEVLVIPRSSRKHNSVSQHREAVVVKYLQSTTHKDTATNV